MLDKWQCGQLVNPCQEMSALTESIIIGALFGQDFKDADKRLSQAIRDRRRYNEYLYESRLPWKESLLLPVVRKNKQAIEFIDQTIFREIRNRQRCKEPPSDFLTFLMQATYDDGTVLTDQEIRDELLPLTTTGYETTGDGLNWLILLLSLHGEVQSRVAEEAERAFPDQMPGLDTISQLSYTEMVVAEGLRLYPPTWAYVRVCQQPNQLPSGVRLESGDLLFLSQYLMHRHPAYFEEPHAFLPERFSCRKEAQKLQFVYFPFGVGAHRCIGEHLAKLELRLALSMIAQKFTWTAPGNFSMPSPIAGLTLRSAGVSRVRLKQRHRADYHQP